ncbi:MAG: plasma-membrane proton-efflux P-type ATPase [Halobacteriota archaeon]
MDTQGTPVSADDARKASVDELFERLSSSERGLSTVDATKRLQDYGPNEIAEKRVNPLIKFLSYFWGPIPWMIEVAVILSAIIQHYEDFFIILALLLLNAVVGFWEENKAANAIGLLKRKLAVNARVLRDGAWATVPARQLVPGDIVRVRLGDVVPADVKLTKGDYLLLDESALTGESLPVEKHGMDVGYSGSIVRQGEMDALVVSTGMGTYFGKTARLVEEAKTRSHFQRAVIRIGDYLIALAIGLAALIVVVALIRQESILSILQFALVLTVAAIPVALPAVLSVTMAVGAIALARKEAIVSKLVAIEEMAGVDILCSDKTGTITKNELTLADTRPLESFTSDDVLRCAVLASRAEDQDPIDATIIAHAKDEHLLDAQPGAYDTTAFVPFDPVSKRTEATVKGADGSHFKVSKGAPQAISALISQGEDVASAVNAVVDEFAHKGYRALGVAKTDSEGIWHYVGVLALYDPPREDSAATIQTAQLMGVDIKMVTGDHTAIAKQIASEVHLGTNIIDATSFAEKPDEEAADVVEAAEGFAQVFPEHKYRIVELLQGRGHIVGMTGDGVNDAPALKKADAGIAVAGATDAAKSAADIVLTNPGLSVIVDAIKESRRIFQRMTSYSIYRIGETIRVLLFITLTILIVNFYPVTAIMIVLLALLNDGAILTIAYDRAPYRNTPEAWDMRTVLSVATLLGTLGVVASFSLFYLADRVFLISRLVIQSMMYLKLSVAGHFMIFVARTRGPFWSFRPAPILVAAVLGTQFVATLIAVYGVFIAPIGWALALVVWAYAMLWFLITDVIKVLFYRNVLEKSSKIAPAPTPYVPATNPKS